MESIQKFFRENSKIIATVCFILVSLGIFYYIYNKDQMEGMADMPLAIPAGMEMVDSSTPSTTAVDNQPKPEHVEVTPVAGMIKPYRTDNTLYGAATAPTGNASIAPADLLPQNVNANTFNEQFPSGSSDLSSKNFLTAGFNVGINTVTTSKKNPNLQLRSDPYIPPAQVGPWNQSTITPDLTRREFELGTSASV